MRAPRKAFLRVSLQGAICILLSLIPCAKASPEPAPAQRLAEDLAQEAEHKAAAIEYRRLALGHRGREARAAYFWAAAYQYMQLQQVNLVDKMLDSAEDASPGVAQNATLLRAEAAYRAGLMDTADFYLESLRSSGVTNQPATYVQKRRASILASRGDTAEALAVLADDPQLEPARQALHQYAKRGDKRPWLGGLLGMVPGLGYAYSGEYANAVRSLILNGIFIYGMVDAADNENWGIFTAISFFELTWYTGSIYGGIDSAHRHNRDRLAACRSAIDGGTSFAPDLGLLPIISLEFEF